MNPSIKIVRQDLWAQPAERRLLLFILALCGLALLGPAIVQSAQYHAFADERSWMGIARAADVFSNLPFALGGLCGLWLLSCQPGKASPSAVIFFAGLLLTSIGSSWYHLHPDNGTLVIDRLTMVLPFAGILGLAVEQRISERSGSLMLVLVLLAGPLSLWGWAMSGNVLGWAIVQFGGMLLLCALCLVRPPDAQSAVSLLAIVLIYGLAKICERLDGEIFQWTGYLVSGHSLKHLVASLSALPVLAPLLQRSGAQPS